MSSTCPALQEKKKFRGVDGEEEPDDQEYDDEYEEEDQGEDHPEPEADPSAGGSVKQIHERNFEK